MKNAKAKIEDDNHNNLIGDSEVPRQTNLAEVINWKLLVAPGTNRLPRLSQPLDLSNGKLWSTHCKKELCICIFII